MKKGIAFLLAVCMLCSFGLASLAETLVFSFTITEYTGEVESALPESGLLDRETLDDPNIALSVQASDYREAVWSNVAPAFTLSLSGTTTELPEGYSYGFARTTGGKVEVYSLNSNIFQPCENGEYKVQFLVLDAQGKRAAVDSTLYDLKLDFTPPSLLVRVVNSASMNIIAFDQDSGIENVAVSGEAPQNPTIAADGTYTFSQTASKSITYPDGTIIATDKAGNTVANNATVSLYVLNASAAAGAMGAMGSLSGLTGASLSAFGAGRHSGASSRTVYHSKADSTSVVAYNAVELNVQNESMTRLKVGNETLDLELYHNPFLVTEEPERRNSGSFSASFGAWNGDVSASPDTLILAADEASEDTSTWVFSGKVYKKLAASGIDYLVLRRGNDVTALSTAGFTAGIRYSMYRAAGLGSSEFEYAVSMSDDGLAMNVTVDGQTYPLSQDTSSEFYYYDVFSGTVDQLHYSEG